MSALEPGQGLPPQTYQVTRDDLLAYAEASGDHNPIHHDDDVAAAVGLPGVIAHGMLTLALAGRAVATWTDNATLVELGAKFIAMVVIPPDAPATLTVAGTVKASPDADRDPGLLTIALEVTCEGAKVLGNPLAVVRV